jgi:hypothetical protein
MKEPNKTAVQIRKKQKKRKKWINRPKNNKDALTGPWPCVQGVFPQAGDK